MPEIRVSNGKSEMKQNKQTQWPLVRKRTTPTERPPQVVEF
jgi:hypothetical protein